MRVSLNDLPPFICYRIAAHVPIRYVRVLETVNHRWHGLIHSDSCWSVRCTVRYNELMRQFTSRAPASEQSAIYERVSSLLRSLPDDIVFEGRGGASLVLLRVPHDVVSLDMPIHKYVNVCSADGLPLENTMRPIVLATTWDRDQQRQLHASIPPRSILFSFVPVYVLVLVPGSVYCRIPQMSPSLDTALVARSDTPQFRVFWDRLASFHSIEPGNRISWKALLVICILPYHPARSPFNAVCRIMMA